MKNPFHHDDTASGEYRIPAHRRAASARRSRWGLWTSSLLGVVAAVSLIILTGTGGATADVPRALQVGSQAAPTTVVATVSTTSPTTTVPVTSPPTTVPTTHVTTVATTPPSSVVTSVPTTVRTTERTVPTTEPTTTTTRRATPITIVIPKSKVIENDGTRSGEPLDH